MEELFTTAIQTVMVFFGVIFGLIGLTIFGVVFYKVNEYLAFHKKVRKSLSEDKKAYLFIKIPPSNNQQEQAFEEFLRSLHRVLPKDATLSLEMFSSDQFLRFYLVTEKSLKSFIESQLYAQYPEAEVEETKEYLPEFDHNTAFAQLNFKRSSIYPLKTHHALEEDILKSLSAILSKTDPGEKAFLQLVLKKAGGKSWQRGKDVLLYDFSGKKSADEKNPHPAQHKLLQDLYLGKMRLAYSAPEKGLARTKLDALLGLFKNVKGHNELKVKKLQVSEKLLLLLKARAFLVGDLWSAQELATLYHFPYKDIIVSNVINTTSKRAPAPDILPREGSVNPQEVSFIGETNYRSEHKKFGIKRIDRRRHLYVVGKTGSGKSKLLELLLISDIQNGEGCCLIDPHGDLAEELLTYVPKERIKDVVYIDPANRDYPIGFNPLEPVEDYETRQHLATFFISIFKKLFAADWNPRMEHLVRFITLALLETPDSNVLGIPRILSDTAYRQRVIKQIKDPVVKSFWTTEFSASNEQFISAAAVPIMNKVGQFISNPIVRNMVGQQQNALNFEKFMNEGKIVLINISKGKLGDDNAALLGAMFITKIQQAALARAKMREEDRRDFYFYVDEFQNFATDAFSNILSEARKYHLDLTIAHQYIAQLPQEVKATAFGNVGSIIVFAVGGDDAAYLEKEFSPVFTANDLINLNTREMYIKMSIDGKLTPPFSARTLTVPKSSHDYSDEIKNKSSITYGKNRVAVENEIKRWSEATEAIGTKSQENEFPEPIL